ncbi:MAG: rhomboid family intramembrane serine protease [Rhodothermales bacterium]
MELWRRFRFWYSLQPPVFRVVLMINVVIYVVYNLILANTAPGVAASLRIFWLDPNVPEILTHPWQILTYGFFHGGFLHVLFNMLWLYWLGRDFERQHGSVVFAAVFFGGVIGAAFLTVVLHAAFPGTPWFAGPVIGASGGVLSVLAAMATFHPYLSVSLLLIGRVPLPVLVIGFLILDLAMSAGGGGGTAIGAHWGGALAGYLMARGERSGMNVTGWGRVFVPGASRGRSSSRRESRSSAQAAEQDGVLDRMENWLEERRLRKEGGKPARIHKMPSADTKRDVSDGSEPDIDKLLDKISEQGYDSLTDEEKKILYEASQK